MPPSVRYMNQSAPFWDFIASLENQGANHPFANQNREGRDSSDEENTPWGWGWGWGHPRAWHRGPPPPFGPPPPPGPSQPPHPPHPPHAPEHHEGPPGEGEGPQQPPHEGPGHERRHGRHGPGPHRRGSCGGRRGFGGRRGWGGPGGPFNMGNLSEFIQSQMFGQNQNNEHSEDFKPEADVFDTESAYVVHASLPGAKKEDIAVNWDVEKSELSIAGVIYRPGDEDFLKTLALDERKVGAFEKKVRLGSRANPAQIDADGISAKLEDGVLQVTVPKQDKDYVEVKKVDIE